VKRVLVTGANGFIGTALCKKLHSDGLEVIAALRRPDTPFRLPGMQSISVGRIDNRTDWTAAVAGADAVVHMAARVHVMADTANDPLSLYRQVNVEGTGNLAGQAAGAGVKRFVYLSSIKVHGEENDQAYSETDALRTEDDYGISKMEAEEKLKAITRQTSMEHVILRPPLVYGPGVKANFLVLMRWIDRRIPLPLGSVANRRSLIYVGNLVDAVIRCLTHIDARNQTFLVSDCRDLSTPDLIRLIAAALGRPSYLPPFPPAWLRTLGRVSGKTEAVSRLLGSLTVDTAKIIQTLDWVPPFSVQSGLHETAKWFREGIDS
jgi:nucleoside-diphosphate-sugar epimerase